LQYAENLTDRQAANAVRERIDWKYSLGLDLTDAGFDFSLLSEFRQRLVEEEAERLVLDRLLEVCKERGWRNRRRQTAHRFHPCARPRAFASAI
jgi:transposase